MSGFITECHIGFRALLLANADVNTLTNGQVFLDSAPSDAITPYIVFFVNSGRTRELAAGFDEHVVIYNVQAIADIDKDGAAVTTDLMDAAHAALHRQQVVVGGGLKFYQLKQQTIYGRIEYEDRRPFAIAGGLFRLEVDQDV